MNLNLATPVNTITNRLNFAFRFLCLGLILASVHAAGFAQMLPKDAAGWSILTPSTDSRLIYVSLDGNNATARPHTLAEVGTDPRNPSGTVMAYQTLAAARSQMRSGYPDWLIIKRGGTYTEAISFGGGDDGGRSGTERHVYTYYGTSGNRPLLTAARWSYVGWAAHIAIVGLEVHYRERDPASPAFVSFHQNAYPIIYMVLNTSQGNILIEDCVLRSGRDNMTISAVGTPRIPNVEIRRCAMWDGHDGTPTDAHSDRSQGLYAAHIQNLVVEECFFDHNGWAQDVNGAPVGNGRSIFSHNIYLANGSQNTIVRRNVTSRAAANGLQARAGNFIDDNLFVANAIAMFSAADPNEGETPENDVTNNVLIAGDDILPSIWGPGESGPRGWGLEVHRKAQGLYQGNIILDENSIGSGSFGIKCTPGTGPERIKIWDNIIRNWHQGDGQSIVVEAPAEYDLQNNIVDGVNQTTSEAITFVDGGRTLSSYLTSIGLSGDDTTFLRNARAAWIGAPKTFPAAYGAAAVNAYFREGFTISSTGTDTVPTIMTATLSPGAVGTTYTRTLVAINGNGARVWSLASGSLPAGLVLSSSGVISGTPTSSGTSEFTVRVADSDEMTGPSDEDSQAFSLLIEPAGVVPVAYPDGFINRSFPAQTGTFTASFDATPSAAVLDASVSLAGSVASDWAQLAATIRFNPSGFIDARNGTVYASASSIPYAAGTSYHFRLVVNVAAHTYSVYVTPAGGAELLVGSNFAFRSDQSNVAQLNNWVLRENSPAGDRWITVSNLEVVVSDTAPVISTVTLPNGAVGAAYSHTLAASGGNGTLIWSLDSGALPPGLSLSSSGTISGTPTAPGTSGFTVRVADSDAVTGPADEDTQALTLMVDAAPPATNTSLLRVDYDYQGGPTEDGFSSAVVTLGSSFTHEFAADPTETSGTVRVTVSGNPGWADRGRNRGNPADNGAFTYGALYRDFTFENSNTAGPDSFTLAFEGLLPNREYSFVFYSFDNNNAGNAWTQTFTSPTGTTGVITWGAGTPTSNDQYAVTVTGTTDASGSITWTDTSGGAGNSFVVVNGFEIHALSATNSVPQITTTSLPAGTVGTPYSQTLAASGGDGLLVWSLASGTLPAGLTLSEGGVLSGTPAAAGTSNITIRVVDSDAVSGAADEDTQELTLTIATVGNSVPEITTTSLPEGTVGVAYSQALTATGGNGALVWSLTSGTLPTGVSLSGTGIISGTPTVAGTSNITIRVADSDGMSGAGDEDTQEFTLIVAASENSVPMVTTTSLPDGTVGAAYAQTLTAAGGDGALVWTLASGTLPAGMTLSAGGFLSGTPTAAGVSNLTVRVADSDAITGAGDEDMQALTLTIDAAPPTSGVLLLRADYDYQGGLTEDGFSSAMVTLGSSFTHEFATDPAETSGTVRVTVSGNPGWADRGRDRGNPVDNGAFTYGALYRDFTFENSNTAGPDSFTLAFAGLLPNREYRFVFYSFDNNNAGNAWTQTFTSPTGTTGVITWGAGTPTSNDQYAVTVTGTTDASGSITWTDTSGGAGNSFVAVNGFEIHALPTTNSVPEITTTSLPAGTVGSAYSQTLTADGGNGVLVWSLASGTLPAGVTLSESGVISGTPTAAGTSNITVRVGDSDGVTGATDEDTQELTLTVSAPGNSVPEITTTSLPNGQVGVAYAQTLSAVGGDGALVWSLVSGALPTGMTLSEGGVISGTPTAVGTSNLTVRVADSDGVSGAGDEDTQELTIDVVVSTGPTITQQPTDVTVAAGETASFVVAANSSPAPTFQWRRNGQPITGATAATLTIANAQQGDIGTYDAVVTGPDGISVSDGASLTVIASGLARDANGWTILTPSPDSRLIYVSSSTGNDANSGLSEASPKATLAEARALMRNGFPDWLMMKRGDTFTEATNLGGNGVGGRSGSERWVFTYYGTSGSRPLLTAARWEFTGAASHVAVVGLEAHYRQRDPLSPSWVAFTSQNNLIFSAILNNSAGNFLLEDCVFRNGRDNIAFQGIATGARIRNVEVRRCAVWDGYNGVPMDAHEDRSQGIYCSWIQNLVIEESFFDHNGWVQNATGGLVGNGRSIFSHNVYLADGSQNTIVRGNLISRAAANGLQARAGNFVTDNLLILNAIGLFSAANAAEGETPDNVVTNNVLIASDDIAPSVWGGNEAGPRGWGIEVHRMPQAHYEGNILFDEASTGSPWAINCTSGTGTQRITVWNNIIRNWPQGGGQSIAGGAPDQYDLQHNIVNGIDQTTGAAVVFADGNRTLSTYLATLAGSGDNLAFLANARAAWLGAPRSFPGAYTAPTVNRYFRAGFSKSGVNLVPEITTSGLLATLVGAPYSTVLEAVRGDGKLVWSLASGALPAGMALTPDGRITGTATSTGTYNFTVRVADEDAIVGSTDEDTQALSLNVVVPPNVVPNIVTTVMRSATSGTFYEQVLQATGGNRPHAWTLSAGALPPGLSLSPAGAISGVPTATGTFNFTVTLADSDSDGVSGPSDEDMQALVITVHPAGTFVATTGEGFYNTPFANQTGIFAASFDAVPSAAQVDAVFGLSRVPVAGFGDLAAFARFNSSGRIDARNGGTFAAASVIPYAAGVSYHFRFVVNVPAHTYSAYVTPAGGAEITIGEDFAFRTDQAGANNLNNWALQIGQPAGATVTVTNFALSTTGVTVPVAGVNVVPASVELAVAETRQLTAPVTPANATIKTVSWSSSDPAVATVSSTGHVTAVSGGQAIITATTQDGGFTATSTVSVNGTLAFTTVLASNTHTTRKAAATGAFAIDLNSNDPGGFYHTTVHDYRSGIFIFQLPELDGPIERVNFNAFYKQVGSGFSVSLFAHNPVTSAGAVQAAVSSYWGYGPASGQPGTELMANFVGTGSSQNSVGWVTADVTEFVRNHYVPGQYLVLRVGSTFNAPTDAASESLHPTSRALFDGGASALTNNRISNLTITTSLPNVPVTGVSVTPTSASLQIGDTQQITAAIAPANATNGNVSWTSSAPSVATVSGTGLVTAVSAGQATITAATQDGGFTAAVAISVASAPAAVTLDGLMHVYDGSPKSATAVTDPIGLEVEFTYDGSPNAPVYAGSYAVVATISDPNYSGTASGTLVIEKAPANVSLGDLNQEYDGSQRAVSVTTNPADLPVAVSYNGSAEAPVAPGAYAVSAVVVDPNYFGAASGTLTISQGTATITLGDLHQAYDGTPKSVSVTTVPADLDVVITYDDSPTAPTLPGAYLVTATIDDPNYSGTTSGTLIVATTALVRHGPSINGGIDGSIQLLSAENVTLNGNAWVSGDLLVVGTPTVVINGNPVYGWTKDATGSPTPSHHTITLNGNSLLRHVVRRVDAIAMPLVATPPAPTGTNSVTINNPGQVISNWPAIRNLTLNGNAGRIAVPAGVYGNFIANGNNEFALGVAGSTEPTVYHLQNLVLNGNSRLVIVGPVVLTMASGVTLNGHVGSEEHPEWLELRVAAGGVTLNGNTAFHGSITAPSGTVTINASGTLSGRVAADRLVLNGNGQVLDPEL